MYNVVIYHKNLKSIKRICNIFRNFSEIRIIGIVTSTKELLNLYNNSKIDMIILQNKDLSNKSISKIIEHIKYKIIISTNSINTDSKYTLQIPSYETDEHIIKIMKNFIYTTTDIIIRKKVNKILCTFNFDFKLQGTKYLQEAIVYSYLNRDTFLFDNLESNIYPYVSEKYNVNVKNIKWSIIRSINNMKSNIATSELQKFFITVPEKITSKFIILEIVNKL